MTVSELKEELRKAENYRAEYARIEEWDKWANYYRGRFASGLVPYNLTFGMAKTIIPNIYFRTPIVLVTPTRPEYTLGAKVLEAITNSLLAELKVKSTMKRVILHSFLFGTGVAKIGFDSEYGYAPELEEGEGQVDTKALRLEYNIGIKEGNPWVSCVHPRHVLVPWGVSSPSDLPWVAFEIWRHIDAVKADRKYSKKHRKNVKATNYNPLYGNQLYPKAEYCCLYEVHDYRDGKIYVFDREGTDFLREDVDYTQVLGLPVEFLIFNEDSDVLWGISDVANLEPQQLEMNETRTQQTYHRRANLVKLFYDKNRISTKEIEEALLSEDVIKAVAVDGPPSTAIFFANPTMPQDLELWTRNIRQDVRETIGLSRNQLGEFDVGTRRTASEALIVRQAADIRLDERRDIVADFIVNIVRKMHELIYRYWTTERVTQILGPDFQTHWIQFSGEDLRGEYQYKVDISSEIPMTRALRKQTAIEVYNLLSANPQLTNQPELIRWLLEHYEGLDIQRLLIPQGRTIPFRQAQEEMFRGGRGAEIPIPLRAMQGGI